MDKKLKRITLRVGDTLAKKMLAYRLEKGVGSNSELLRYALTQVLEPDIEDGELVFQSLQSLHAKLHKVSEQQDILFQFLCFFIRNWFAYHPEVDAANIQSAALAAKQRYESFFQGFRKSLADTPLLQSVAADLFEETP